MTQNKLIIEVRMNELSAKAGNPNIPYVPAELIDDAVACADAGAAIVHFHARTADGAESNDADAYASVISGLRARSDILIHTTLGQFDGAGADQRTAHIRRLSDAGLAPDIAPLDMGTNNIDIFDAETHSFAPGEFIYQNRTSDLRAMAEQMRGWGIKPQMVNWSVPNGRLMLAFLDAGLVSEPAFAVFLLAREGIITGHPATLGGIEAYVDLCVDARVQWSVMAYGADILPLVPGIIRMGGHVSIGLGDHPYADRGQPANADLVREVVDIARSLGRDVATPAEARDMLQLPSRVAQPA